MKLVYLLFCAVFNQNTTIIPIVNDTLGFILVWFKKKKIQISIILTLTDFHICSQGDFSGKCLLYGSVRVNISEIDVSWSSTSSLCYFVSGISVCVAVFCFSTTLYWVYTSCVDGEIKR